MSDEAIVKVLLAMGSEKVYSAGFPHTVYREVRGMRKRERRKRDLLSGWNVALIRLCVLFLCGGIAGSVFVGFLAESDSAAVSDYLADYLSVIRSGVSGPVFCSLLLLRMGDLLAAVALGLNVFGVVGLPLLMGVQGFFLAFSVGMFCLVFGLLGLSPGIVVFGLPALLWCPALMSVCVQGLDSAGSLLRRREWGVAGTALYWLRILLCFAVLLVAVLLESAVVPQLLGKAADIVL